MRWVVGTGRCGLHNYTALVGGYIHSDSYWREQVVKRHHGAKYDEAYVDQVIKNRMEMDFPCVTDCAQFMFIDRIIALDPDACFVWITRDKKDCVGSLMQRVGEDKRIHPEGWDFRSDNKQKLIEWYYDEVQKYIKTFLTNHMKVERINTYDMEKVVDKNGVLVNSPAGKIIK